MTRRYGLRPAPWSWWRSTPNFRRLFNAWRMWRWPVRFPNGKIGTRSRMR